MRRALAALVFVVAVAAAVDLSRAASDQVLTRVAVGGIHLYQATLSRVLAASGAVCRFDPTCSHYGEAVIRHFGVVKGGWLAMKRVLRCGPWTPAGTLDPPPVA